MEQWEKPCVVTLRITNPKTLEKWKLNGEYDKPYNDPHGDPGFGCNRGEGFLCSLSALGGLSTEARNRRCAMAL